MSVVADVDAELAVAGLEDRICRRARLEEEFLPEAGDLWDMGLAVFAEIGAIGIDDGGGVVVGESSVEPFRPI